MTEKSVVTFYVWSAYHKIYKRLRGRITHFFFKRHAKRLMEMECGVYALVYALEQLEEEEHLTDDEDERRREGRLYEDEDWFENWRKLVRTFDETFTFEVYNEIVEERKSQGKQVKSLSIGDVRGGLVWVCHRRHYVLRVSARELRKRADLM
jgi:hypothetical protein